jgi:hypothetical protein
MAYGYDVWGASVCLVVRVCWCAPFLIHLFTYIVFLESLCDVFLLLTEQCQGCRTADGNARHPLVFFNHRGQEVSWSEVCVVAGFPYDKFLARPVCHFL